MKQKIFLAICILILSIFGISIFSEFMANHTYYNSMFAAWVNWKLIIWVLVATFVPVSYILWNKTFKLKTFLRWRLPLGLLIFAVAHTVIKGGILGSNAFLVLCLNTILLYAMGLYFIIGTTALGTWIADKWIKFKENRRQEMMLKFGIGLGIVLLLVYILAMATILWGGLVWIIFVGLGVMVWYMKDKLGVYKEIIEDIFNGFKIHELNKDTWKWIGLVLIGICIVYYFYGFQLSFIPYSTAWDANHAYMYEPKVLAENAGVLRGNVGPAISGPQMWHAFITFWFALITPIKSWFWLAPDTVAVSMNFLSGILVMLFGIGTIKEIIEYFTKKIGVQKISSGNMERIEKEPEEKIKRIRKCLECGHIGEPGLKNIFNIRIGIVLFLFAIVPFIIYYFWCKANKKEYCQKCGGIHLEVRHSEIIKNDIREKRIVETTEITNAFQFSFYSGWALLLLWLSSGMGAFLVFVDNKTDLGVLALTLLAVLSGFIFLKAVSESHEHDEDTHKNSLKYIMTSGVMFTWAIMAKPTAFIDVALFGLLLVALWINQIIALGLGIMTIGMMGVMKVANAPDLLSVGPGKVLMLIGALITIIGIISVFMKGFGKDKKRLLKYIAIWGLAFLISLAVLKGPNVALRDITQGNFNFGSFGKSLILGKTDSKVLLAATEDIQTLNAQAVVDQEALSETVVPTLISANSDSLASCKIANYTEEELQKDVRKAIAGNEDVGRYVGYGWKDITKGGGINLGYGLLRIFYPSDGKCYGLNSDAKILCKNAQAIDSFNVEALKGMMGDVSEDGEAYKLLSEAISDYEDKNITGAVNPAEFRDNVLVLRGYYQDHSIATQYGKISIPYRYMIPFNVVFNRSLQNLSSYYTDIGFIWLFMLIFIVVGFIYGLVQKNNNLVTMAGTAMIGRGIWWIIGGGIVWYGMGLIIWTILTVTLFIKDLFEHNKDENDKTMFYIIIFLLAGRCVVQLFMNLIRISSQGAGGPFLWYKGGVGKTVEFTDQLQQSEVLKAGYGWKDVFDLQFPHYNKFMEATENRANEDGVLIAGTYIQYFLKNQRNIKGDGMLGWFWEKTSDNDSCKSYKRLQDSNIKYLVIDPNIGTVVMGEGNESLFNRFFAKKDPVTGKIQEHGAISMLVKLWKEGYISLFGTNNLGAKYAFSLDDTTLKSAFGDVSEDELLFIRAKLAIARFFPDAQQLVGFIGTQFINRIGDGQAIGDMADVYGKIIDEAKLMDIAKQRTAGKSNPTAMQGLVAGLTQDERFILAQYLGLYNIYKAQNQEQLQEISNNILGQSLGGSSQLIVLELN